MSTPIEPKRNTWVLPGLILWAFAPAILIASSILGGWYSDDYSIIMPGRSYLDTSPVGEAVLLTGIFGMPIILYPWSVAVLLWFGVKLRIKAALIGIPLTLLMCAANIVLGFAGCTALSKILPKEGLF